MLLRWNPLYCEAFGCNIPVNCHKIASNLGGSFAGVKQNNAHLCLLNCGNLTVAGLMQWLLSPWDNSALRILMISYLGFHIVMEMIHSNDRNGKMTVGNHKIGEILSSNAQVYWVIRVMWICVVARSRRCYLKLCEAALWCFHERFCSSTFPTYAPMFSKSEWFQEPSHVFFKEVSTLHLCGVLKPGALPTAWEHRSTGVLHRVTCTCCPRSISEEIVFKLGCRARQSEHIVQN